MTLPHHHRADVNLDDEIDSSLVVIRFRRQVRQRLRIVGWPEERRNPIRLQRLPRHDPRRDARRKVLGQKRSEWLILPRLDVPRGPIVHQAYSEQMLFRIVDGDRLSKLVTLANEKP